MGFMSSIGQAVNMPNTGSMAPGDQQYTGPYQGRPDLGPNVGFGVGLPAADNPVYGQQSPFQPPPPMAQGPDSFESIPTDTGNMSFGGGKMGQIAQGLDLTPTFGVNPGGMSQAAPRVGGLIGNVLGSALDTGRGQIGAPVFDPITGQTSRIPGMAMANAFTGNVPGNRNIVQRPSLATTPGYGNRPATLAPRPTVFRGGLRPAPRNYRPPMRGMR